MKGLRAALLLGHVVVTGGFDDRNSREEVSVNFVNQMTSLHVQVLEFNEAAETWSEMGRMKKARSYHAVVAVDVNLFCPGIVGQTNKKQGHHQLSPNIDENNLV